MDQEHRPVLVRTRLSVMMFLQYFIWSAWFPLAGYMPDVLGFSGDQSAWVMSTTAIGAILAPLFVGLIADRYFATERVLAVLHIVAGICLCLSAGQRDFRPLMVLMVINGLCYMPTLALTNSIAFRNIDDSEKEFPILRVWGTIGWVVAGLLVGVVLGQKDHRFFYLAGGASILMGLYCWTLPHTPPKRSEESAADPLGLRALGLLREPSFAIFVISAFMVCLVLSFYWVGANPFLVETDRPAPAALMTLGQISEIFFMAAMPWFLARLGLKRMLLVGIFAWVVRYACFSTLSFPLILFALVLHGICYDFFFVAAYIYVDKKAPSDLRASAQSLITLVMLGVGMFVGMNLAGRTLDLYPSPVSVAATSAEGESLPAVPLPDWPTSQPYAGALRYLDLSGTINRWLRGESEPPPVVGLAEQLGSADPGRIQIAELAGRGGESIALGGRTYKAEDLASVMTQIDGDGDGAITRAEWRAAQAHRWPRFWMWPLVIALITGVFFWLGFDDRENCRQEAEDEPIKG